MWQAISRLLSEQLGEGEIELRKVWAVGADRDYSFLVMDYLPPRPLDAHSVFILGQQIARLHQWSDQPQFGLDFDNALSTTPQPNTWQRRWSTFFAEQRIGWQLELAAEKGIAFGNIDAIVEHIHGPATVHWVRMARTFSTRPATGVTESATWRCYRCILNSRHKSMTAISQYPRYLPISLNVNRFTNSTRC